ncbi:hypothetical protein ASH01_14460 [Terrabacter sp. Soil811]|nr:hypothetical protein ASH01_14460 [Terrabacter sp. Soil811]
MDDTAAMTPEQLRTLLSAAKLEAVPDLLSLLDEPQVSLSSDAEQDSSSTATLLTIYRRRAEHVRRTNQPIRGIGETVEKLETTKHQRLVLAVVNGAGESRWGVAFLSPDLSEVVAAVARVGPHRES